MGGHTPPKTAKITYQLSQFFDIWQRMIFFCLMLNSTMGGGGSLTDPFLICGPWW
jgi:hypothetical protein